jgi:hypothetical protein
VSNRFAFCRSRPGAPYVYGFEKIFFSEQWPGRLRTPSSEEWTLVMGWAATWKRRERRKNWVGIISKEGLAYCCDRVSSTWRCIWQQFWRRTRVSSDSSRAKEGLGIAGGWATGRVKKRSRGTEGTTGHRGCRNG